MHHLHEMTGAIRPAMQPALLGRATGLLPPRRARDVAATWRKRVENRVETSHDVDLTADHHAIAPFESPDAAARADINIMDALDRPLLLPAPVISLIPISPHLPTVAP